ncbi:MAG: hypothetical protein FWK04_29660 [Nostoc sp. GBBB01]|nr:hypothetical protein [Nostoc sp. GBBB01]
MNKFQRQTLTRRPNRSRKSLLLRIRQLCRFWQPIVALVITLVSFFIKFWQPILAAIAQILEWASHFLSD